MSSWSDLEEDFGVYAHVIGKYRFVFPFRELRMKLNWCVARYSLLQDSKAKGAYCVLCLIASVVSRVDDHEVVLIAYICDRAVQHKAFVSFRQVFAREMMRYGVISAVIHNKPFVFLQKLSLRGLSFNLVKDQTRQIGWQSSVQVHCQHLQSLFAHIMCKIPSRKPESNGHTCIRLPVLHSISGVGYHAT